ncbi:MAG: LPXTG cell wall anchor domain-containing protein, partial [Lachnospiraceae bacterium]|nr:LPXTG cell wall anchor domain-containing protein [Lachnospiraceae bacterium]
TTTEETTTEETTTEETTKEETTTKKPDDTPKTGDPANVVMFVSMFVGAVLALAAVVMWKRKGSEEDA